MRVLSRAILRGRRERFDEQLSSLRNAVVGADPYAEG